MKLVLGAALLMACTKENPAASCAGDGICSDPEFGFCDVGGIVSGVPDACIAVDCAPGEFEACRGDQAITCNATGDNFDLADCDFGCSDERGGCEQCTPNAVRCDGNDGNDLVHCSADGIPVIEPCAAGCVEGESPHCRYVEPRYLPDVCDVPAEMPELIISSSGTLDTDLDSNCTGGIVEQVPAPNPSICVIRYGTITIEAMNTLRVDGKRLVAFVTDGPLTIAGILDVSADGSNSGPGVGVTSPPDGIANSTNGDGGAAFRDNGAAGGSPSADGGGATGGVASGDPSQLAVLAAGRRTIRGGGGGGATLISCRSSVVVTGMIDAGGGGGGAGGSIGLGITGGGGGSGGYVVLQGLGVEVSGEVYANGGGGGSGKSASGGFGLAGSDGTRSATDAAAGGAIGDGAGAGGSGGVVGRLPGVGKRPTSANANAGGGGGSTGFFQTYTPEGVIPILEPLAASPPFQSPLTIPTR